MKKSLLPLLIQDVQAGWLATINRFLDTDENVYISSININDLSRLSNFKSEIERTIPVWTLTFDEKDDDGTQNKYTGNNGINGDYWVIDHVSSKEVFLIIGKHVFENGVIIMTPRGKIGIIWLEQCCIIKE